MISDPKLEQRPDQHTAGIRIQIPMSEIPNQIPQLIGEMFGWLEKQGIEPVGDVFIRYHVINMEGNMDMEIGIPVENPIAGDDRVKGGVIPAGQYAVMTHTGPYDGLVEATAFLLGWAEARGIVWDRWDVPEGDAFRARIEYYPTDPAEEPDPQKWETVLAFRLADEQVAEQV